MAEDTGEDLYSDSTSQGVAPSAGQKKESTGEETERVELLPKSFFPEPPEPGKVFRIRVSQVMEDQVAVAFDSSSSDSVPGPEPDEEMSGYMS